MSTDIPRYSTPRLRAFALWAQALSGEGNSLGDVLQTYVDNWADDIEALAQPQPSLSQKMLAAGYTPRDRKIECDECGKPVSPQMMPLHECAQPEPEPVAQVDDKAWQATMMPHPQPQPEVPVPAPPFDPAVEPPWHRSDMGPAQPEAKDDVAYCQWCDRPVSEHAVIGKCEFVKGRKLPQPDPCELTDKEIWKLWLTTEAGPYDFARAVLAAAREKP